MKSEFPRLKIRTVYNRPVIPEQSRRFEQIEPKPVARRDLPKDFQESVQMGWNDDLIYNAMFDYDFATAIRPGSMTMFANRPEDGEIAGWRDVARKYARQGLILNSIWGIRHGIPFALGTGEITVPEEMHQFLLDTFGPRFLGWENGEQDGEYVAQYVFGQYLDGRAQSPNRSRKEAYEHFVYVMGDLIDSLMRHYIAPIGSLPFCHYFAELGHRILGLELGTGLPSSIMRWAFLRGASKQYELLTHAHISVFMASAEQKPDFYSSRHYPHHGRGTAIEFQLGHPAGGPPIHLVKRLWFASYMYGVSILGLEGGLFYGDVASLPEHYYGTAAKGVRPVGPTREGQNICDVAGFLKQRGPELEKNLTPLGREYRKWVWATRAHPDRGMQYTPIALILDFYHGWTPPVHKSMGQGKPEHVWGNIPYSLGDYQIDQFFRWVYPDYQMYGYHIEGRGCLTPTPFGDYFDVLLTNAGREALNKYQAAILLGDIPPDEGLEKRLESFVRDGGTVVLCAQQLSNKLSALAGVRLLGRQQEACTSQSLVSGVGYEEGPYLYDCVELDAAEALAVNERDDPVVCLSKRGDGCVVTITPVFWGPGRRPDYKWHVIEGLPFDQNYKNDYFRGRPQPPVQILNVVQEIVGRVIRSYDLLEITGRPIQYIVNVTNDPRKLLITLINNGDPAWEGTVAVKNQQIVRVDEWLSMHETCIRDGVLQAAVAGNDVRIYEVTCRQPFLELLDR